MRLFIIMGLGLTLTVTSACQGGGKRRMSFKKESADSKANSPRAKAISGIVGDGKCLRIDKLVAALAQTPSETMVEYTSDTNFVDKNGLTMDVVTGGTLLKAGSMAVDLNLEYGEKCETVTLVIPELSAATRTFVVDKESNKNQLILTRLNDQTEKMIYEYDRKESLKITHIFAGGGAACGKGGNFKVKRTTTLAFGEGLNEFKISRTMLSMLDRGGVTTPTEVTRKLMENAARTNTVVSLGVPSYELLVRGAAEKVSTKAICP